MSGILGSIGVDVHRRGVYHCTPLVLSQVVLVFSSFVRESAPSWGFPSFGRDIVKLPVVGGDDGKRLSGLLFG